MKRYLPVLILVLAFWGAAAAEQDYVIGEGDLLKIAVYDHPDLATEVRVSGDGRIAFPLIGEVAISGLTVADAERTIAAQLGDGYIVHPHVSVFISEYKSKKVTVLGEVAKPGIVVLRGSSTLMEVLSDAGGITPNAGDAVVIQRMNAAGAGRTGKEDATVIVDTKRLFEEGDATVNIPVQNGDSIYVPKAAFVYVNGEVKTPGAYKITKGLTVLKSITLAGGFSPKASESRTRIIRKTVKGEETINARMDDLVMPDDVILVPESLF
jgi:polysaccharide export outer membrane protein